MNNNLFFIALSILITSTYTFCQESSCNGDTADIADLSPVTKCSIEVEDGNKDANQKNIRIVISTKKNIQKSKNKTSSNNDDTESSKIIEKLSKTISANEIAKSIPLSAISAPPLFPRCNKNKDTSFACFNIELSNHIQKHLRYPDDALTNNIEGDIWVRFIINAKGEVTNIQARGPDNATSLIKEAKVIIAKLPKFKPASIKGEFINVKYSFPMNFKLNN